MVLFRLALNLGHTNIAGPKVSNWKGGYRDFDNTHYMDKTIIDSVNSLVTQEDTLYFLGDFCLKNAESINNYRNRLNCKNIVYILGNHDKRKEIIKVFGHSSVYDYLEVDFEGIRFVLSHYAHRVWNKSHHGNSIHLYGHSHGTMEHTPWGKSMDVGIDSAYALFGEYRPFSLSEIIRIMSKRETKFVDHHKDRE